MGYNILVEFKHGNIKMIITYPFLNGAYIEIENDMDILEGLITLKLQIEELDIGHPVLLGLENLIADLSGE